MFSLGVHSSESGRRLGTQRRRVAAVILVCHLHLGFISRLMSTVVHGLVSAVDVTHAVGVVVSLD